MSNLLLDEYPLLVLPKLATLIGLNEAIVLQQINYWIEGFKQRKDAAHYQDGRWWVYNTIEEWQENFPFWSTSTIRRAINSLREKGLVQVGNYNKVAYDKTLWYAIDYDAVSKWTNPSGQNEQMDMPILDTPIPETTHETTQETSKKNPPETGDFPESEEWPEDSNLTPGGPPTVESTTERDPIVDMLKAKERIGSKPAWTVPAEAGGADVWANGPLTAFMAFAGLPALSGKKQARAFARELEKVGTRWQATPSEVVRAIEQIPKSEYKWFRCGAPMSDKWHEIMDVMIPRVQAGQTRQPQAWSKSL